MAGRASQSIVDDDFLTTENVYEERDVGGQQAVCDVQSLTSKRRNSLYVYM
jgi:hypothetical protein